MHLNATVWCKIGVSPIHGVGVFAIRDIPKGQRMYCQSAGGKLLFDPLDGVLPEIKQLILSRWPYPAERGYLNPNDDARLVSFMNHSQEYNYDWHTDTALKDIHTGQEVTEDYGYDPLVQSMV